MYRGASRNRKKLFYNFDLEWESLLALLCYGAPLQYRKDF